MNSKHVLGPIIIVAIIGVLIWWASTSNMIGDNDAEISIDSFATTTENMSGVASSSWITYEIKELGITFKNPNNWIVLSTSSAQADTMLEGFDNPLFLAYKPGMSCAIVIGDPEKADLFGNILTEARYEQRAGDADIVEKVLVGNRLQEVRRAYYEYKLPNGEPRDGYYTSVGSESVSLSIGNYDAVMGMTSMQALHNYIYREGCSEEFAALLESIKYAGGKDYVITDSTNGILHILRNYRSAQLQAEYVITLEEKGEEHLVTYINPDSPHHVVADNDGLYYTSIDDGLLHYYALKTKRDEIIALQGVTKSPAESMVNYFIIENSKIYYLAGKNCNEYRATCNNTLYLYDSKLGTAEKIISGLKSRRIYGTENGLIYMAHLEGDAGMTWQTYEIVSLETKKMVDTFAYSQEEGACDSDGNNCTMLGTPAEHTPKVKEIESKFGNMYGRFGLKVEAGKIMGYGPEINGTSPYYGLRFMK